MTRTVTGLILVGLAVSAVAVLTATPVDAVAGGTAQGPAEVPTQSGVEMRSEAPTNASEPAAAVTVSRASADAVRYELSVAPADAEHLWLIVGGLATVSNASGFERAPVQNRTRLRWTGDPPARLTLTVSVDADDEETVATDAWTFTRVPFVELQWAADRRIERAWPMTERDGVPGSDAITGDRYALVGDYEVIERSTATGTLRLVVPAGTTPREDPSAIADALVDASGRLNVGDRGDDVLAFAVPHVRSGGESVPARDEFWVAAASRLDAADDVWLHEYVHTRQSLALSDDMQWFREASAEYYAVRLSHEQGRVGERAMQAHLDGGPSNATLAAPTTWDSRQVPLRKGARVLAVLDRKIRAETHGQRSLEDVFRRLNGHDGTVTDAVFEQTVAEVAGTPMGDWLDRHVAGPDPVTDSYPAELGLSAAGFLSFDPHPTPATFLFLTLGLSLIVAVPLYHLLRWFDGRDQV